MSPFVALVEGWGTPWQRTAIVENKYHGKGNVRELQCHTKLKPVGNGPT